MTDALKPCPFCGCDADRDRWDKGRDYYGCRECDYWLNGIEKWNTRAPDPRIVELEAHNRILNAKCAASLANNLCPDHRDKQTFKPCLACTIERLEAECERLRKDAERIRQEERAIAVSDCVATALMTPRSECPDIPEHRGREFERGYFYSRGASDVEQNLARAFEKLYFSRPDNIGSRENAYKEACRRHEENAIKESER